MKVLNVSLRTRESGALGYTVAGRDRMGLPPLSAVLAPMPRGSLTARLGARIAHLVSRRRLELCFANYLIGSADSSAQVEHSHERMSFVDRLLSPQKSDEIKTKSELVTSGRVACTTFLGAGQ